MAEPTRTVACRPSGRRRRRLVAVAAVAVFAACVTAANLLTARYGLIPVGFGLSATAGTWAAGLCLTARDWVHDAAGRTAVLAAIAAGALAGAATASPRLAVASAAAFVASELADTAVYQPLRRRSWAAAVAASNTIGALVDTLLFLHLAGFTVTGAVLAGQLTAKTAATLAVLIPAVVTRAVLRHRLQPDGA